MLRHLLICCGLLIPAVAVGEELTREQKVRNDRQKVEAEGFWIYNDLDKGFAEARRTGKPLLVVLRCIPCEECVKLDDDLVDQDPVIRPLLDEFVCVRQVSTNGLDLSIFQYDTDQSFAVFMLNADGTIYGRFGTRSHRTDWLQDVSLPGMAKALQGALRLHAGYPANRQSLVGKTGPAPDFPSPEKYPALSDKYTDQLDQTGSVVASCIHCHQIGDAQRSLYRESGKAIPDHILFPYPHPKTIGVKLDPQERATVAEVTPDSIADRAGLEAGDEILRLDGQPMLSMADVQWVLHQTPSTGDEVEGLVRRGDQLQELTLTLPNDWRLAGDISWRVSTWGMRRMATGGLSLEELPEEERQQLKLQPDAMALRVKHVGQWGAHAAAKHAGFQEGDVIVGFDGRDDLHREADLIRHAVQKRKPGEKVTVAVLRDGKQTNLQLPMQE